MKTLGFILVIFGALALVSGAAACFVTLNSTYASSTCEKAAADKIAFDKAKNTCGAVTSDCYRQITAGLTAESECTAKKSFMRNQLILSVTPVIVGILLAAVGLLLHRRKARAI